MSAAVATPARREAGPGMTVALTAVAFFMVVLDALVVVTALPTIHRDLGGSLGSLQWTVNAYNMAFGAGIVTAAAIGDRLGRRRVYVGGLGLFSLASAACALAPTLGLLIGARAVQGLGAAVITPLSLTILTAAFPPERRGAVIGMWGGISGLGVAAGPLIGGAVTQGLSWHWIFWVNVPVGIAGLVLARTRLPESFGPRVRLDVLGLGLVSVGAGALIWSVVQGSQNGWVSASVLSALAVGVVALAAFLWWEAQAPEPMIPLGMFRNRSFSAAVGATFLLGASIYSAAFLISQLFQFAFGDSPLSTGLKFLPWTATPLLVAPLAGAVSDRVGTRPLMVPGLVMQGAGFAWIVALVGAHSGYPAYVAPFVLAGIGVSMAIPTASTAAMNALPPEVLGKASAVVNTLRQFGAVFGIALVTAVFNARGSLAGPAGVTAGFRPALATSAALSLLAAGAAWLWAAPDGGPPSRSKRDPSPPTPPNWRPEQELSPDDPDGSYRGGGRIMAQVIIGNHAAVVVPREQRERVHAFYCGVLGFEPTRQTPDKDDLQLGEVDPFFLSIVYGDVADESELLRSGRATFLELKTDDVSATRERILASGVLRLEFPDPHLYFQAPGGQVFRLIGIDEDMSGYERDVVGDEERNARLVAAVRRDAEQLDE